MKLVPRSTVEEFAHEQYKKHFKARKQQEVLGALEIVRLVDKRELVFQQRVYRVPPVPFDLAAQVLAVKERMVRFKPNAPISEVLAAYREAARLSKLICRPKSLARRLLWWISPNPFLKATPYEVGHNLAFFSMSLALDRDPQMWRPVRSALGTYSPTSSDSPRRTRRSSIDADSPSPGVTS